jgi:hypothetical protein
LSGSWDNFAKKKNFSVYEFFVLKRAIGYVGIVGIRDEIKPVSNHSNK